MSEPAGQFSRLRLGTVVALFGLAALVLAGRAFQLQVLQQDRLKREGDARAVRVVPLAAHRGRILDRHGQPLAISTPVDSVWANPAELMGARHRWPELARALGLKPAALARRVTARRGREFVYLRRQVTPAVARRVRALGLPGVGLLREYRRYYPAGEVAAHVLGFTDVDDRGQEGLELALEEILRARPGRKRVVRDRKGHVIKDVELIQAPRPGRDVILAMDRRLQYLAYRELKRAVLRHRARGGSAVILDARTGEVLAMANQPGFNPNDRSQIRPGRYRNRAVTDVFEPGSAIKPFTVAAALERRVVSPRTVIDTAPGLLRVGRNTVRDVRNYGAIDVATIIRKSSNVGAARIALATPPEAFWRVLDRAGFGQVTAVGFPGEAAGRLAHYRHWRGFERAALAFGYGTSVTALQLAQAYTVFANGGRLVPASLLRLESPPATRQVVSRRTAQRVLAMLEGVVSREGTAAKAAVPGYRVAGKTGTVKKAGAGGYAEDAYLAVFVGIAPVSDPRLVMVVTVDDPRGEAYYGGEVAAPVFRRVMQGALRLLEVPPDGVLPRSRLLARVEGGA